MSKHTEDMMLKFNRLKEQYEAGTMRESILGNDDEDIDDKKREMDDHHDLIEKMDIFALKVKKNMLELKNINHEIFALQE